MWLNFKTQTAMAQRKLAAIMFSDIVGYTALMGSDEDKAFQVLRRNRIIQQSLINKYHGKWLKEMGDGILAQFGSATDSVQCAIEIQKQARKKLEAQIRIGIHLGDVTFENEDVFGDGVNIASRLQSIADPGGIYISESIHNAIRNQKDIYIQYLGEVTLKNVNYPFKTYYITEKGLPIPSKNRINELTGAKKSKSVVVLPFDNYTGSNDLEYFVAGMHASLIGSIGKISALRVISKTTSNAYKDTEKSISDIASELEVSAVIEASVLSLGDKVCLQVKLIDTYPEEKQIWVQDYIEEKNQILNLYNAVTKEISNEINAILTPEEECRLAVARTIDSEVYDLYLKSHMYWDKLDKKALDKAKEFLTYAIEKDPDWAPLYAGLANVWIAIGQMGHESPEVVVENVYENLNKALEKDPTHWESHLSNAHLAFNIEWNWEKAEKEFLTAIDLNPNDAMARLHYSHLLMVLGRISEALEQGKLGINLDPLNPFIQSLYSVVLVASGDYPTALMYCEKSLSIDPDNFFTLTILELVSFANGNYERTIDAGLQWLPLGDEIKTTVKQIYKEEGFIIAQNEIIIALEKYAKNNYYIPPDMAMRYVWVTNVEKALDWLERGYEVHDQQMTYIYTFFGANESIKDNPRFIAILEKMNLPLP